MPQFTRDDLAFAATEFRKAEARLKAAAAAILPPGTPVRLLRNGALIDGVVGDPTPGAAAAVGVRLRTGGKTSETVENVLAWNKELGLPDIAAGAGI